MKYKILIVEDEESGRIALKILLEKYFRANISSITFSNSFESAQKALDESRYNLVFLDINLNGISAFDLLSFIPTETRVIFVTAYSEFILKAFRSRAFDYLVKPVKEDELKDCLTRYVQETQINNEFDLIVQVKQKGMIRPIHHRNILFIEGDGPYSRFQLHNESLTIAKTLKSIETDIGPGFIRVHKSYLVNKMYIKEFKNDTVTLHNGKWLKVSRTGFKLLCAF